MSYDIPYVRSSVFCSCLCVVFCATQLWILTLIWHWCWLWGTKQRSFVNFPADDKPQRDTTLFGSQARWPVTKDSPCQSVICAPRMKAPKLGFCILRMALAASSVMARPGHSSTLAHQSKILSKSQQENTRARLEDLMRLLFLLCIPTSLCDSKCNDGCHGPSAHQSWSSARRTVPPCKRNQGKHIQIVQIYTNHKFTLHVHACTQYFQVLCSLR